MVLMRILELLGVLSPIVPFSAYHIAKQRLLEWPRLSLGDAEQSEVLNRV